MLFVVIASPRNEGVAIHLDGLLRGFGFSQCGERNQSGPRS
jgi:hypothetical protein